MKKVLMLILVITLLIAAVPAVAGASDDPYGHLLGRNRTIEQFTPEALIAANRAAGGNVPNEEGLARFRAKGYIEIARFMVGVQRINYDYTWEVIVTGDIEYAGVAYLLYEDGTIIQGVVE